ncbi:MAG: hypothetical protein ACTSVU_01875 [Promethearchaeota archaeon]
MLKRKSTIRTIFLAAILLMSSNMINNSFLTPVSAASDGFSVDAGDSLYYRYIRYDNSTYEYKGLRYDFLEVTDNLVNFSIYYANNTTNGTFIPEPDHQDLSVEYNETSSIAGGRPIYYNNYSTFVNYCQSVENIPSILLSEFNCISTLYEHYYTVGNENHIDFSLHENDNSDQLVIYNLTIEADTGIKLYSFMGNSTHFEEEWFIGSEIGGVQSTKFGVSPGEEYMYKVWGEEEDNDNPGNYDYKDDVMKMAFTEVTPYSITADQYWYEKGEEPSMQYQETINQFYYWGPGMSLIGKEGPKLAIPVIADFSTYVAKYEPNITTGICKEEDASSPSLLSFNAYSSNGMNILEYAIYRHDNTTQLNNVTFVFNATTGIVISGSWGDNDHRINFEMIGNQDIDTYGYQVGDVMEYMHPPMDDDHDNENYDQDWLEENDDYYGARFLDIPGFYHDMITEDPDYYQVHLENGDFLQVDLWCENGADIQLTWMNDENNPGYTDDEELSPDGHCYLDFTSPSDGEYVFRVDSHGYYRDHYDLEIHLNYNNGPDYWPDENNNHDDKGGFEVIEITNIYENLYTGEHVMLANISLYEDGDHDDLIDFRPYEIVGRVIPGDVASIMSSRFFMKDLQCDDQDLIDLLSDMAQAPHDEDGLGITSEFNVDATADMLVITGMDNESMQVKFYIQKLPGDLYGGLQYLEISQYNETEDRKDFMELSFYLNGPGIASVSTPQVLVNVGDSWIYLMDMHEHENSWSPDGDYHYDNNMLGYMSIEVTHIVKLFNNTVGIFGKQQMFDYGMEMIDDNKFTPLLIFDTTDILSFMNMAGYGEIEGPPMLVPAGIDWTLYESELIDKIMSDNGGPMPPVKSVFESNIIRIHFDIDESDHHKEQTIIMEIENHGILSSMTMDDSSHENYAEGGYDRDQHTQVYLVSTHLGGIDYLPTVNPASVVSVHINDEFIWEMSHYNDDPNDNHSPDQKDKMKLKVKEFVPTMDDHMVILGEIYNQKYDETTWNAMIPRDDQGNPMGDNLWIIGSPRDGDVWSIIAPKNFFAYSGLTDFTSIQADLITILNFALPLPDGLEVTSSDITCNGTSFVVTLTDTSSNSYNLRYAINEHAVLQDMLMGQKNSNGDWVDWDRTVLSSAPSGYTTEEYFTTDIPLNYAPVNPTTTTTTTTTTNTTGTETTGTGTNGNPFGDIPGYSPMWLVVIAFASIAIILKRKQQ